MAYQGLLLTCLISGIISTQKLDQGIEKPKSSAQDLTEEEIMSRIVSTQKLDNGLQKLKFSAPVLTEEEENSVHLPDAFKCDACKAIAFQLTEAFENAEKKFASRKTLTESEIFEITDNTCEKGFDMYGLKSVNEIKHLSGPGLEAESVAGIVQMGGKWPQRVRSLCSFYMGEIGEEKMYDVYKKASQTLVYFLCMGNGLQGSCNNRDTVSNTVNKPRANFDDL